jgi:hypothetical protein
MSKVDSYLEKVKYYDNLINGLSKYNQNTENFDYVNYSRKKYKYLAKIDMIGGANSYKSSNSYNSNSYKPSNGYDSNSYNSNNYNSRNYNSRNLYSR